MYLVRGGAISGRLAPRRARRSTELLYLPHRRACQDRYGCARMDGPHKASHPGPARRRRSSFSPWRHAAGLGRLPAGPLFLRPRHLRRGKLIEINHPRPTWAASLFERKRAQAICLDGETRAQDVAPRVLQEVLMRRKAAAEQNGADERRFQAHAEVLIFGTRDNIGNRAPVGHEFKAAAREPAVVEGDAAEVLLAE